jgi:hypothetical protein
MTLEEEDKLAKQLSEMTPFEYASLMRKVNRVKWEAKAVLSQGQYERREELRQKKRIIDKTKP